AVVTEVGAAFFLASCSGIEPMQPPVSSESARNEAPAPPPGGPDEAFLKLPRPLSVHDAKRVVIEATVFAPWGIGYGGRPLQALALTVLLGQPSSRDILVDVYDHASLPGKLLALCGLQSADP